MDFEEQLVALLETERSVVEAMVLKAEIKLDLSFFSHDGTEFAPDIRVKIWRMSSTADGNIYHAVPSKHFKRPRGRPHFPGGLTGRTPLEAIKAVVSSLRSDFLGVDIEENVGFECELLEPNSTY